MNKSQIIAVQASAGSGKTYNLAKRYIYLLLSSNDCASIKNIIAVTFTNKAAVEMKRRVMDYLKKGALSLDAGDFFNDLPLTKNEIAEKSLIVLKNILEFYDNFNISTMDSFKNHILKSCAISIGIPPNFTIERDYTASLLLSLEIFLQKSQESEDLKNIVLRYLSQYLMTDSSWIPKDNIYNEIVKVFNKSGTTGKDIFVSTSNYNNEFSSRVKIILEKIKSFVKLLPKLQIYSYHNKAVDDVLREGAKIFFSMKVSARFAKEYLQYKKDAQPNPEADDMWRDISVKIKSLYDFHMENYYVVYSCIYSKVALELDMQSKKDGIVFLNEINKRTVNFFEKNNAIIPEVYYRLSERYKHFLIDEFQDTSFVQWAGMKSFLEESLAANGTFFYVGDVKQAIYDFRGGKPELFDEVLNEFPSAEIEKRLLKQNFRSGKTVVDFNNNAFSKENIERFLNEIYKDKDSECDFSRFIKTYAFSYQEAIKEHDYGYVKIDTIDKACANVKEETKQKFMDNIHELLSRFNSKNIAVLCRTNNEISDVSSWLLEDGLEIESSQTLNVKNNIVIKQILSILMFINSPIDSLAFASFIMGDIFSKVSNAQSDELEKFVFVCNKDNRNGTFYKTFKNKYDSLWKEYFEFFFVKAGFIPVYELTLSIIEKFKITDNFPQSKAFIMCLLEFIKEFETQDSGLKNFLEYFKLNSNTDALHIKKVFGNGIKIMTIHEAKGLQFPVVIVPFLKLSETKIDIPYCDDSGEKIKMLGISKDIAKFSTKAKKIYDTAKLNALLSELNMLYVSMTRAEYELYAIIPPKAGSSNNVASVLFGGEKIFVSGVKQKYNLNDNVKDDVFLDSFDKSYKDIQKYLIDEKKTSLDINDAAAKGTIIHYALSTIVSLKNENIGDVINNAWNVTKRKFFFENVDFVKEKLEKLFLSKEILSLFMYDKNEVYNEKEIVNANGESFRIDKLIISSGDAMIVDFKSSNYDEIKNRKQLRDYADLISEIYPSKRILSYIVDIDKEICLHVRI
ncbi:UvrD/REP helicase [Endomicrobiia bacterium]|nr:UvrD/REP helicase [Endomicrobiia bacterium]GHT74220.1 UvrD/REP helicase [Endomicrobiia bacterium]